MTERKKYSKEFREKILEQLKPPINKSVPQIHKEYGISRSTIYTWISKARQQGHLIPNNNSSKQNKWSNENKARIVLETYTMNEQELGEYCRKNGLYSTDVKRWHRIFESSFSAKKSSKELEKELIAEKNKNKMLEKELDYKEKALAEAAALLVLKKKTSSILRDP